MPSPDPDALAPEDGSPPRRAALPLYRSGEPRDLGATVREWHDLAAMTARVPQEARAAGLGGIGDLLDAVTRGETVTRTDARLRISGPDRYRVDYRRRARPERPAGDRLRWRAPLAGLPGPDPGRPGRAAAGQMSRT